MSLRESKDLRLALIDALEKNCHVTEDLAIDGLDSILDTLADRADEWADSGREFDTISSAGNVTDKGYVWRLVAVLRGDE